MKDEAEEMRTEKRSEGMVKRVGSNPGEWRGRLKIRILWRHSKMIMSSSNKV